MKKTIASLGLAAGALLAATPASAAITLLFSPSATHIDVGQQVTVDVSIAGLGAEVLSAYDLNFLYDPSILNWFTTTQMLAPFGPSFPMAGSNGLLEGNLGFDMVSLETDAALATNQADAFQLFSFTLRGVADGTTQLTLGADLDFERAFGGLDAQALTVDVGGLCIAVGTGQCNVPEPASYGLVGLALAGALLPGLRRRRQTPAA